MTETKYPYGYGSTMLTMDELKAKPTWANLHTEFQRRLEAMMVASNGELGVGTGWRSSETQERVFFERHTNVSSGGCCVYKGKLYQLKKGMAHAAPPGKSFHESVVYGSAAAADMVGNLNWMHLYEGKYGFKDFRNVGNEPWHIQFVELPNSVTQWKVAGSPQPKKWPLPSDPEKPIPPEPPKPTMPATPTTGVDVYLIMKYGGTADSNWSGYYSDGTKRYQINAATGGMDHVARLVRAGAKDAKTNAPVSSLTWAGVSWTNDAAELTKYLGPS